MTAASDGPVRVEGPALGALRCGLLALSTLGLIGAGTELAAGGHGFDHLAPSVGLALLAVATVVFVVPGRPRWMLWVRVLCLVVLGAAAYSVAEHMLAAGDPVASDPGAVGRYWAGLSALTRSWYGASGDLGPSTPLAPGMLGQTAILLLLATLGRHGRPATV